MVHCTWCTQAAGSFTCSEVSQFLGATDTEDEGTQGKDAHQAGKEGEEEEEEAEDHRAACTQLQALAGLRAASKAAAALVALQPALATTTTGVCKGGGVGDESNINASLWAYMCGAQWRGCMVVCNLCAPPALCAVQPRLAWTMYLSPAFIR